MIEKIITKNKKAFFDYEVLETFESGVKLFGHEVKSIRQGKVNLKGSYVSFLGGFANIKGLHITPFINLLNGNSIDTKRDINIFLHKKDIYRLIEKTKIAGFSVIPLEIYLKGSLIKLKVGLCKGKKEYDKKQILKERTLDKEAKIFLKKIF